MKEAETLKDKDTKGGGKKNLVAVDKCAPEVIKTKSIFEDGELGIMNREPGRVGKDEAG